jgi:cation diffusion facilitator family transporter
VAAGLAVMVFVSAYEIAREALVASRTAVQTDAWMLLALVATVLIPLAFARAELRAGRAANSPALIADAREYQVHVFTTGLAFVALLSQWVGVPLDRIAALFIVVAVVKTGWDLLHDAMRVLLDASLDAETLSRVRECIHSDPAVSEVPWVMGRNAGRFRFVEAGVALRVAAVSQAEAAVRRIEASVRASVPHVERALIHVESPHSRHVRYAVPLDDPEGTISAHFGAAQSFAIVTVRRADGGIEERRIVPNPHPTAEKARGIRVAEWLVGQKVDVVLMREDVRGKGPGYVLRDAGVDMRITDRARLDEALRAS